MNPRRGRGRNNGRRPSTRVQTFDSNGPNIRIRGNANQVLEKYLSLARDATASGDRISAENYYQHAEHYYRIINAANGSSERSQHAASPPQSNGADPEGNEPRGPAPADEVGGSGPDQASA